MNQNYKPEVKFFNKQDVRIGIAILFVVSVWFFTTLYQNAIPHLIFGNSINCFYVPGHPHWSLQSPCQYYGEDASFFASILIIFVQFFGPIIIAFAFLRVTRQKKSKQNFSDHNKK